VLNAESLGEFMEERIRDGEASVVVFAMDHLPRSVAPEPADTVLFRRYLDAGGKVVWLGLPPMILKRDPETNRVTTVDRGSVRALLDVDIASANSDSYGAATTDLGRQWGAPTWWIATLAIDSSGGMEILGLDENGRAAAWVKSYGGAPGTGFVSLSRERSSLDDLAAIRAMAEYGIMRGGR
jgi:hypothetical protein